MVASHVGKPLFGDKATLEGSRLEYARVCIDIEVGNDLPKELPLTYSKDRVILQAVRYEWIPHGCKKCKLFGHLENDCRAERVYMPKVGSVQPTDSRKGTVKIPEMVPAKETWTVMPGKKNGEASNLGFITPPEQSEKECRSKEPLNGTPLAIVKHITTPNPFGVLEEIPEEGGESSAEEETEEALDSLKVRDDVMKHVTQVMNQFVVSSVKKKHQKKGQMRGGRRQIENHSPVGDLPQL